MSHLIQWGHWGYQIGIGQRIDKFKYELSYSDFEDINISSSGGGTNSISATLTL